MTGPTRPLGTASAVEVDPATTCPVHQAVGEGRCAQCGRVVCAVCRRTRDTQVFCDGCQPFSREAPALAGWSLVATVLLFLTPLRFVQSLAHAWDGLRERSIEVLMELEAREWLLLTLGHLVTRALVTVVAMVALRLALARRSAAPRWMLGALLMGVIAEVSLRSAFGGLDATAIALLVAQLLFTAWWARLMLTSEPLSRLFVH